jgi:hypothetical protein
MALHLAARLAGEECALRRQRNLEYDPDPPFGKIDWSGVDLDVHASLIREEIKEVLADAPELASRLTG